MNHAYPDYGKPGPNYDWYGRALLWWDYWLIFWMKSGTAIIKGKP